MVFKHSFKSFEENYRPFFKCLVVFGEQKSEFGNVFEMSGRVNKE